MMDSLTEAINRNHDESDPVIGDTLTVSIDQRAKTFKLHRAGNDYLTGSERAQKAFIDELLGV